jgi:UDP-2,3-diacylglucosamine hydrolase
MIGLRGFAARAIKRYPTVWADMLDPNRILDELRGIAPDAVVLAGNVTRPGPLAVGSVYSAFRNRGEISRILSGGDDRILRGVIELIEEAGFRVVGAQDIAPGLLASAGCHTKTNPDDVAVADIGMGIDLLNSLSRFDVGQACVVSSRRVLAVEGPEGTDAMLERVRSLQRQRKLKLDGGGGVLVKMPKAGQDTRIDLPAIGPRTIEKLRSAGLKGVAIAANGVVIIDRRNVVKAADTSGIFVTGEVT